MGSHQSGYDWLNIGPDNAQKLNSKKSPAMIRQLFQNSLPMSFSLLSQNLLSTVFQLSESIAVSNLSPAVLS